MLGDGRAAAWADDGLGGAVDWWGCGVDGLAVGGQGQHGAGYGLV